MNPSAGSLTTCKQGNLTNLDTRGTIFIDLIHCAAHNPAAVLQPINALHFSLTTTQQALLEQERQQPWRVTEKPHHVLQLLLEANGKDKARDAAKLYRIRMKQQFKKLTLTVEFRAKLQLVVQDLQRSVGLSKPPCSAVL